jgi:hypothetical protein
VKLLYDENLSPALVAQLAGVYPEFGADAEESVLLIP